MTIALPHATATSTQAWKIMEQDVALRHSMTPGFNEQHHKDLLALNYEAQQKGNAGYYFPARIELEIRDTNDRAQALYDACCEVWEIRGFKKDRAFYRAVLDNCLDLLFGTRRSTITAEFQLRDVRMGRPGNSKAARGSLSRRMAQLRAEWNIKLEIEARDNEARERFARGREIQTQLLPTSFTQTSEPRSLAPRKSNQGRKDRLPRAFLFLLPICGDKQRALQSASLRTI